jgi:tRNA1Val (adenine37-N6)-methyltransferase
MTGDGFAPDALTEDAFLGGRLRLLQPRRGYRAAIDPVLLAAFVPARAGARVLDLGCGAGAAALCLAARVPGLDLHGLEIQPDYADLARRNAGLNEIGFAVHEGNLRRPPAALRALSFDWVLANPPFHGPAAAAAPDAGRDMALREGAAGISDWIDAGLRRLAPGGGLALVHRPDRLGAILAALEGRAGGIEILPVAPRAGGAATRLLLRTRKGSAAPLALLAPLTLHAEIAPGSGAAPYNPAAERVLREMGALPAETDSGGR